MYTAMNRLILRSWNVSVSVYFSHVKLVLYLVVLLPLICFCFIVKIYQYHDIRRMLHRHLDTGTAAMLRLFMS